MSFLRPRKKRFSRGQLRSFWKDWLAGKKTGKKISEQRNRKVFALNQSGLATVRRFHSRIGLLLYKRKKRIIEKAIIEMNPKTFELQKAQFFGENQTNLLERVYRAPTLMEIIGGHTKKSHRYLPAFWRRMERKGLELQKINEMIKEDAKKLDREIVWIDSKLMAELGFGMDNAASNLIVLDYNPEKRKFLIAIVDLGGSIRE